MPKIAEFREIDGATWVRVDDTSLGWPGGRIQLLSDDEITANAAKWEALLAENERLRRDLAIWERNGGDIQQRAEIERLKAFEAMAMDRKAEVDRSKAG